MKLTFPQIEALKAVGQSSDGRVSSRFRYATLEALRRRGLIARYTTVVRRAEYADKNGVQRQKFMRGTKQHEWWMEGEGRRLLDGMETAQ